MPSEPLPSTPSLLRRALPRGLTARLTQARRDAGMIVSGLRGVRPPPYLTSAASRRQPARRVATRELRVSAVTRETPDTVTLTLVDPTGAAIDFLPGQFFTVFARLGGEVVARNYSASCAPNGRELSLTIKRVRGGRVSAALQGTRVGDALEVGGPYGGFTVTPDARAARSYVLVAGGSGITPLLSIARAVLAREPRSRVSLVYGSRSPGDVIFARAIDALARENAQLDVKLVVQEATPDWQGAVGRVDADMLGLLVPKLRAAGDPEAEYYVCGPDGMRAQALSYLAARGVHPEKIHVESFTVGAARKAVAPSSAVASRQGDTVALKIAGQTHKVVVPRGSTLLEAATKAGLPMPFSCSVGGCGACRAKLVLGEVEMDEPNCLTDDERAQGMVLCCVGRPKGACAVEIAT